MYKSVQNIGGIGSAKSSLNIEGRPPKIPLVGKQPNEHFTARAEKQSPFTNLIPSKTLSK